MAVLVTFSESSMFELEVVQAMSKAFDDVRQTIGITDRTVAELVAKQIIATARGGERSREQLRDSVLKVAGAEFKAVA